MIKRNLENFLAGRCRTLLGVGPMSKNCVDVVIELANTYEVPLLLIASRRQIDSEEFGGGYVNNWSTEHFADYIIEHDKKGKVVLARDHGGPWQNTIEKEEKLSLRRAMDSAKKSLKADIESGFEVIHIDPSQDIFGTPSMDDVIERVFELYEFCWITGQRNRRELVFEIGTEEQNGTTGTPEEMEYVLTKIFSFCDTNRLPRPSFVVIQTGTRVMETRNVGSLDSPFRIADELPVQIQIPKMVDICNKYKIWMKEHNTDYLADETLSWHPKLGIHAANVAPEFGVAETRAFMDMLKKYRLDALLERFIVLTNESLKWEKWMLPGTKAGPYEKALICGHYVFSSPEFGEIKRSAQGELKRHNVNIDDVLKERIRTSIFRYMKLFRLLA